MARSFVLPLSRNRFFEIAPREEPELLGMSTWTSLCFSRVFLLVALHPLLVALHPLTGIEQVIYQWKAAVNMQLSHVDHFFILATILKVFHLIFIQCSRWTSCRFYVELLWCIFSHRSPSTARSSPSTHRNWASDIPVESCCKHATFLCWSFFHTRDDFKSFSSEIHSV